MAKSKTTFEAGNRVVTYEDDGKGNVTRTVKRKPKSRAKTDDSVRQLGGQGDADTGKTADSGKTGD